MKVVALIQARHNSARFPNKIMADICGRSMLQRVLARVQRCTGIDVIKVCTPETYSHLGIREEDVLGRFAQAAISNGANAILRITADCPLIDPELIDAMLDQAIASEPDYCAIDVWEPGIEANSYKFPEGLDAEFITASALSTANMCADQPYDREHVTPYIKQRPETFQLSWVTPSADYCGMKWSVDTPDDLEFVRAVYQRLREQFTWDDVVELLRVEPQLLDLNGQSWRPTKYEY